jgi:hypothetical protein
VHEGLKRPAGAAVEYDADPAVTDLSAAEPEAPAPRDLRVPTMDVWHMVAGNRLALILDLVVPFLGYQVLTARGVGTTAALSVTALSPLVSLAWEYVRKRKIDAIGLVSVLFIIAGLLATAVTGNTLFALAKGSILTGAFGLAFLGSLLFPRPLAFYFGRQVMTGGDAQKVSDWNELWRYPKFRQGNRAVSALWGAGLLGEATLRVVLAVALPVAAFLLVWSPLSFVIYGVLMYATVSYVRRRDA